MPSFLDAVEGLERATRVARQNGDQLRLEESRAQAQIEASSQQQASLRRDIAALAQREAEVEGAAASARAEAGGLAALRAREADMISGVRAQRKHTRAALASTADGAIEALEAFKPLERYQRLAAEAADGAQRVGKLRADVHDLRGAVAAPPTSASAGASCSAPPGRDCAAVTAAVTSVNSDIGLTENAARDEQAECKQLRDTIAKQAADLASYSTDKSFIAHVVSMRNAQAAMEQRAAANDAKIQKLGTDIEKLSSAINTASA